MKTFIWQGIVNGKQASDTIDAPDATVAFALLNDKHVTNIQLTVLKKTRLKAADHFLFLSELCELFNAKLSLLNAIHIIANTHPKLFLLCKQLETSLKNGQSLAQALEACKLYNATIYSLIHTGEVSGQLGTILQKIIAQHRQQQVVLNNIRRALIYPVFVLITTWLVLLTMLLLIIPKFSSVFQQLHATLPLFTRFILQISDTLRAQGLLITGLVGTLLISVVLLIKICKSRVMDALLAIPYLNNLLTDSLYARLFFLLHSCLSSGISLPQALSLTTATLPFKRYQRALTQIMAQLEAGLSLSQSLDTGLFPEKIRQWVMMAESSGTLDSSCKTISDHYSDMLNEKSEKISLLIEPFLMVVLGLGIGSIVVALYLPLFQIGLAL